MSDLRNQSLRIDGKWIALALLFAIMLSTPFAAHAKKKKANEQTPAKPAPVIDYSNIVWPNPPAIARIRYVNWYAGQPLKDIDQPKTKKETWMDRLAGTQTPMEAGKVLYELGQPYGLAVDSKGKIYTADTRVGAIFIFDPETRDVQMIKNKVDAHFVHILGLAMDDNDRLFVSDPDLRHILVFNAEHKATDVITDGLVYPGDMAIDTENRLLYVSDVELDQVLVYDADTFKLIRKMGTTGKHHELTTPGDFAKPTGLAVDKDGNLYVADTLNDRIEIFDADGQFIRTWGKNGDGPGYFARPKGVAIDSDGHVWVADGMQDRVQVFTQEGRLLISFGGHGLLPGQFQGLVDITSDNRRNRIYTSEIYPGRLQEFRYVTDAEFDQLKKERQALRAENAPKSEGEAASADSNKPAQNTTPPPKQ